MKKIKNSQRGLTFCVENKGTFSIGNKYHYIVDKSAGKILIVPGGKMKVSRKRSKALFDIRSKEVRELVAAASHLEVEEQEDKIIVHIYKAARTVCSKYRDNILHFRKKAEIIIPKIMLATGDGCSNDFYQYTLDDYLPEEFRIYSDEFSKGIKNVIKVLSLFSGAGMLDYPFKKDPAFQIIGANEMNPAACESYRYNIGDHITCGPIQEYSGKQYKEANLIIGGPCCQAFSNANRHKKRGSDHIGYRLVEEYARIVKEAEPEVFALENVPEFLTMDNGYAVNYLRKNLADYELSIKLVTDCKLGGYTTRKRIIIIGSKIGMIELPDFEVMPYKTVRDALNKVDCTWYNYADVTKSSEETQKRMAMVPPGGNFKNIPELSKKNSQSNRFKRLKMDGQAPTLCNWRKCPIIHPIQDRTLSVAEASALSGFGQEFRFMGTLDERQQQCGNGVPYSIGNFVKDVIKMAFQRHSWKPALV